MTASPSLVTRSSEMPAYVAAQVRGAIAASGVRYLIASGKAGFQLSTGLASNGYGAHSPGEYAMYACLVAEVVFTFMFVMVVLGATSLKAPAGFAPIAIGLAVTTVHLIGIPVTNFSVSPARSTGPAVLVGGWALSQLWMFWLAPLTGAVSFWHFSIRAAASCLQNSILWKLEKE